MKRGISGITWITFLFISLAFGVGLKYPDQIKSFLGFGDNNEENELVESKKNEMFQMCQSKISTLKNRLNQGETELFIVKVDSNNKRGLPLWENPDTNNKGAVLVNFNDSIEVFKTDEMNQFSFVITLNGYCGWLSPEFKLEKVIIEKNEELPEQIDEPLKDEIKPTKNKPTSKKSVKKSTKKSTK